MTFPSLVSCTNIDWYLSWPEEALNSVAKFYLDGTKEIEKSMFDIVEKTGITVQPLVIHYRLKDGTKISDEDIAYEYTEYLNKIIRNNRNGNSTSES